VLVARWANAAVATRLLACFEYVQRSYDRDGAIRPIGERDLHRREAVLALEDGVGDHVEPTVREGYEGRESVAIAQREASASIDDELERLRAERDIERQLGSP
jgi:hypothetical protein